MIKDPKPPQNDSNGNMSVHADKQKHYTYNISKKIRPVSSVADYNDSKKGNRN
jgi:hypothetical protein